jgi:outer membrane autotransporter protein
MKMTSKLLLAAVAVAGFSGSAMAADLAMPAAPAAPPPQAPAATDWDGAYLGVNAGYGWGTASTGADSANLTGGFVGGQVGYNFHLSDQLVGGVEGNIDWNDEQGTYGLSTDNFRVNWDGSVRARLGLDLDGILPYAEAGVAFANGTDTPVAGVATSATHTGWTAGAGVEAKLTDQVSANLEYRYTNYGSQAYGLGSTTVSDNTVRVGLNYHF